VKKKKHKLTHGHMVKLILFDFEKYVYVGCIPVDELPEGPSSQSKPLTKEICEWCDKYMWVSRIKREFSENKKNSKKICIRCFVALQKYQGIEVDLIQMNSLH